MKMLTLVAVATLALGACGSSPAATQPTGSGAPTTSDVPIATPPDATQTEPPASLEPGTINYRVVNLRFDETGNPARVDVYVRTQGLVQAAPVQLGLAYGEMTDVFAPPEPGTVAILTAGADNPTCVATCPHILSTTGTGSGEGTERTLILYDGAALELWHDPEPASVGNTGNALPPANPSTALILTVAVALHNADFGLRMGTHLVSGCDINLAGENLMVGGNQIGVFSFAGPQTAVAMYDNRDSDCSQDAVGGPFEVTGEPGSRTLLILFGEPGEMEALTLAI